MGRCYITAINTMIMVFMFIEQKMQQDGLTFDGSRQSAMKIVNAISSKFQCEEYYDPENQTIGVSFECDEVFVELDLNKGDTLFYNRDWAIPFKVKRAK